MSTTPTTRLSRAPGATSGLTDLKKMLSVVGLLIVIVAAIEVLSSYALYRYYSALNKAITPAGSAAIMLADGAAIKLAGNHRRPTLSVANGPIFRPDPTLGFSMVPGRYLIHEELDHQAHQFEMSVTSSGRRAVSYVPVTARRRLFVSGDSMMLGWGVDDEQAVPWLLQARFPDYQVVNLTGNSYSVIHALLQLRDAQPAVSGDDVVLITYDTEELELDVEAPKVLALMYDGFEVQLGNAAAMRNMRLPYGTVDAAGNLAIERIAAACAVAPSNPGCARPAFTRANAQAVKLRAFDAVLDLHPKNLVVLYLGGDDDDPVIRHLRARGATIADLRYMVASRIDRDIMPTNAHRGPFWLHRLFAAAVDVMRSQHVLDDVD